MKSTKVKYFGITGTIVLIALSYTLSASTFYDEMHIVKNISKIKKPLQSPKKVFVEKRLVPQTISPVLQTPLKRIELVLKEGGYITFDNNGNISSKSKKTLKKLAPILADAKDMYIEIEGYSLSLQTNYETQMQSIAYAQQVYTFLQKKDIDKKIKLTGYGDSYPISDDKYDIRNSRVELKIRRR